MHTSSFVRNYCVPALYKFNVISNGFIFSIDDLLQPKIKYCLVVHFMLFSYLCFYSILYILMPSPKFSRPDEHDKGLQYNGEAL